MPYDILCDDCGFHKVEHRRDDAEDAAEGHEEETGHSPKIRDYKMNHPDYPANADVSS